MSFRSIFLAASVVLNVILILQLFSQPMDLTAPQETQGNFIEEKASALQTSTANSESAPPLQCPQKDIAQTTDNHQADSDHDEFDGFLSDPDMLEGYKNQIRNSLKINYLRFFENNQLSERQKAALLDLLTARDSIGLEGPMDDALMDQELERLKMEMDLVLGPELSAQLKSFEELQSAQWFTVNLRHMLSDTNKHFTVDKERQLANIYLEVEKKYIRSEQNSDNNFSELSITEQKKRIDQMHHELQTRAGQILNQEERRALGYLIEQQQLDWQLAMKMDESNESQEEANEH
ncbi:hypothetical protein [Algicola sagamiensis]|uniref:hypothetical protein n=1 Tax=Algicola sagamiensis TaxID=163869 RepID=UPI0003820792|nr:hypothetical protein [Algicola sagamiensis]